MENKTVKALQQEQQRSWNKKNHWRSEEDLILKKYVETHGEGNWATTSNRSGLNRSGKCCRLRWKNYLRPNIKRGDMSEEEEELIIRMHKLLGNRWSLIAGRLRGRTDNEVKNYWNTHLNKNSGYPALHSTLPGRERPVPLRVCLVQLCLSVLINETAYKQKQGKQTHPKYTRQYQDNNLYSDKTKNETGNMTREDKLKDGINSKEGDQSSSIIISATTETSYPTNTDHGFNFIYADLDHQFSPSSSWVQYYLPTMGNNATSSSTFLFDDEPFFAFMNSIILLEAAFGYTAAAAGMQSSVTMPFSSADDPHSRHF